MAGLLADGCSHKAVQVNAPGAIVTADNSYADLAPGQHLRVVVPLLTSGGYRAATGPAKQTANGVIELSASDLIGYETYRYSVRLRARGRVSVALDSAVVSKDGKQLADAAPPPLPFELPAHPRFIRLIYFIRNSQSDHNMAVAAARNKTALAAFTTRLRSGAPVCPAQGEVECSWVPAGIAVRPE